MSPLVAEFMGTMLLVLLGDGVVANVLLKETKGHDAGWIVITLGWGMAVFVGVFCVADISGAHLNPAVTVGLALAHEFEASQVAGYILAQFAGAALGAVLVWLTYRDHFDATDDADAKLAVFCTSPAIRRSASNLVSEIIGTFVLVYAVLHLSSPDDGLGSLDALPVGLLVLAIGLSLGGTTGYAINPARDLSPRIMHCLLPIGGKRDSDWRYAWVPVVGPLLGGGLAALCFLLVG
jgi:glycerol uptake facilitator protein